MMMMTGITETAQQSLVSDVPTNATVGVVVTFNQFVLVVAVLCRRRTIGFMTHRRGPHHGLQLYLHHYPFVVVQFMWEVVAVWSKGRDVGDNRWRERRQPCFSSLKSVLNGGSDAF